MTGLRPRGINERCRRIDALERAVVDLAQTTTKLDQYRNSMERRVGAVTLLHGLPRYSGFLRDAAPYSSTYS